jgi:hypothetical protein
LFSWGIARELKQLPKYQHPIPHYSEQLVQLLAPLPKEPTAQLGCRVMMTLMMT